VKHTPLADEFEMYNVSDDPMELHNLYGNASYAAQQRVLAALLEQQCSQKRLQPSSGTVPGQLSCGA
jgi:choline-sulfatase